MDTQLLLLSGGGLAIVFLLIGLVISIRDDKSINARLGRYTKEKEKDQETSSPIADWLNETTVRTSWGENMARELARADIKLKVGEYVAFMVISSIGAAAILYAVSRLQVIFALVGLVIGLFLPRIYIKMQQGKRLVRFGDQLSDMLNLMVNGLRAGYSTMQAMEAVSKELPSPICDEFRRAVQEMQLGMSMEAALDNLLRRIPSPDLDLVVTAINVQREVGGNLAEILETISHTIRERVRVKGEIRVLTSQVVYSGRFLSVLPVIVVGALALINKSYFSYYTMEDTKMIGIGVFVVCTFMIGSGYFVMQKIANIDV
jgi:tight adherence protein B